MDVRNIVLSGGQQTTVSFGDSVVLVLTLVTGVVEIAGVVLRSQHPYRIAPLPFGVRRVVLYSLEGGTVTLSLSPVSSAGEDGSGSSSSSSRPAATTSGGSGGSIQVAPKGPTTMVPVLQLAKRDASRIRPNQLTTYAVIGREGVGKTLVAQTLCNALNAVLSKHQQRSDNVVYCDAQVNGVSSSGVYGPGCMTCVEVDEVPLWPGRLPALDSVHCSFSLGSVLIPHALGQLQEVAEHLSKAADDSQRRRPIVFDIGTPAAMVGSQQHDTYFKKVLETLRPNVVLYVGDVTPHSGADAAAFHALQEDMQRLMPHCPFVAVQQCSGAASGSSSSSSAAAAAAGPSPQQNHQLQESSSSPLAVSPRWVELLSSCAEYFGGHAERPLGAAKIVVDASLVSLMYVQNGKAEVWSVGRSRVPAGAAEGTVVRHAPSSLVGAVLAVSHAKLAEEVPFANIAGLMVVLEATAEEFVLLVPSGAASVPNHFWIVTAAGRMPLDALASLEAHCI